MRYWITDGRVLARSRTQLPGSWQVFNWSSGGWELAPQMDVSFSYHWRQISAAAALQIAAGAQPDDRMSSARMR